MYTLNGKYITVASFYEATKKCTDLSCISLDINKINTKAAFGATIPIIFTDNTGKTTNGLHLITNYEKHRGNIFSQKWGSYSINLQKISNPREFIDKDTDKFIKQPTENDYSITFLVVERVKAHVEKLINEELAKGTIRPTKSTKTGEKDDGKGKLYVKATNFAPTPFQYTSTGANGAEVDILNPMLRVSINRNKAPLLFSSAVFRDNSTDELKQTGINLTTENIVTLVPKGTQVKFPFKIATVRANDKGFVLGVFSDGLGIKRQENLGSANLDDDETAADGFGGMMND